MTRVQGRHTLSVTWVMRPPCQLGGAGPCTPSQAEPGAVSATLTRPMGHHPSQGRAPPVGEHPRRPFLGATGHSPRHRQAHGGQHSGRQAGSEGPLPVPQRVGLSLSPLGSLLWAELTHLLGQEARGVPLWETVLPGPAAFQTVFPGSLAASDVSGTHRNGS